MLNQLYQCINNDQPYESIAKMSQKPVENTYFLSAVEEVVVVYCEDYIYVPRKCTLQVVVYAYL